MKKQDVAHSRQRKTRNKDPKAIATLGVPPRKGLKSAETKPVLKDGILRAHLDYSFT